MTFDLAIVGAGRAGMTAATLAAELGLATLLVDEQDGPGGQIYRGIERVSEIRPPDNDQRAGRRIAAALRASTVQYRPMTTVWHIDPGGESGNLLSLTADGRSETVAARRVVLATGALERPVPIPGWTLPGVMTGGAAQILLKTAGIMPDGRIVLAGQGPLLLLVALQLAQAGASPAVLLETTPPANYVTAMRHARRLWAGRGDLCRGLAMLWGLRRAGIGVKRGVRGLRAIGRSRLEGVAWDGGEITADHLFLHEGVIPNTQIGLALGMEHRWDAAQLCWRPVVDEWGRTSLPSIAVAGDGAGVDGAAAAAFSGRLAALDAAAQLGHIDDAERDRRAAPVRVALARRRALRPWLDALYRPAESLFDPPDDVVVCRCEEVSAGEVRRAVRLGAAGPNQVKAFTRCGMGPCQGRLCGSVVGAIIARARGVPISEIGTFRPRAPYKPITVGSLAGAVLAAGPADADAANCPG